MIDRRAIAQWTARNRRAAAHYAAMPISANHSHATPCNRCQRPTRDRSGVWKTCQETK